MAPSRSRHSMSPLQPPTPSSGSISVLPGPRASSLGETEWSPQGRWCIGATAMALWLHTRKIGIKRTSGFVFAQDWGSRTISSERIRFVLSTEAYGPWWAKHRRPGEVVSVVLVRTSGEPSHQSFAETKHRLTDSTSDGAAANSDDGATLALGRVSWSRSLPPRYAGSPNDQGRECGSLALPRRTEPNRIGSPLSNHSPG